MDKKVLAIIAIGALHLTLMWALRGSLKPEELARGPEIVHPDAAPIEPNPYNPPTVLAVEPKIEETDRNVETDRAGDQPVFARTVSKKRILPSRNEVPRSVDTDIVPQRAVAVAPPIFQDTIIWVKRAEVQPIYRAERADAVEPKAAPAARIATPIKKKRSFFKRAAPVIRKPYDWIKALISKL
jgi:hypothetical protein